MMSTKHRRRYAIFNDMIRGDYAIVVVGDDIETAPMWGGFVSWLGGVRYSDRPRYSGKRARDE